MRCKIGDLVYCAGFGEEDGMHNRGHVGQIVGPAQRSDRDWSVLIPGKPSTYVDGTWAALDSWLIPIRGDEEPKAEEKQVPFELTA